MFGVDENEKWIIFFFSSPLVVSLVCHKIPVVPWSGGKSVVGLTFVSVIYSLAHVGIKKSNSSEYMKDHVFELQTKA